VKRARPDRLTSLAQATTRPNRVPFDIEKYRTYLQQMDIPEAQKVALLQTLWSVASIFVDLAFGRESAQRALKGLPEEEPDTQKRPAVD